MRSFMTGFAFLALTAGVTIANDAPDPARPDAWAKELTWRSIGPANMSGRIVDLAVYEADPTIWWAATASGGLLKTTNNGTSFTHQFDREKVVSIGAVCVAQSDPNILYVGTGESNPRNSVSWGNGVYKSTDGGDSWTHMGLDESFQIGRIQVHPEDPNIVYVGALGRLWGPNEQRGVFKSTDGGETWEHSLFLDDRTGVIDVQMHPNDPDTLIVATYERQRDEFDTNDPAVKWGEGSGMYRTTDGGETWDALTEGLPTGILGRIGLDYYDADPDTIYAVVESEMIGSEAENAAYMGVRGENAELGARLTEVTEDGPAEAAGLEEGDIVLRIDDSMILSYQELLAEIRRHTAGDAVRIEVVREREPVALDLTFGDRPGAEEEDEDAEDQPARRRGQSDRSPFRGRLGGQIENIQDQQGDDGHEYGGVYKSTDGGDTWTRINSVNPRPMYFSQIRVDPSDDQHMFVLGVSLYRSSDGGETFTGDGGSGGVHVDHHAMWVNPNDGRHIILGNDGGIYITHDRMETWDHVNRFAIGQFYHVTVDNRIDYRVYGGLQDNGSWGAPARGRSGGTINEDWFRVGGGDGFLCLADPADPDLVYYESQNGGLGRVNLRTGDRGFMRPRPQNGERYRFNWKTPFKLSQHNSKIYYTAGNYVFRSLDRGNGLVPISPEITPTDRGSATAFAESALDANVLYAGTDDGGLVMTRDGGATWIDLFALANDEDDATEETEETADADDAAASDPAEEASAEESADAEPTDDPVTGIWSAKATGEMIPADQGGFTLTLTLNDDDTVSGRLTSEFNDDNISEGKFDREKSKLTFVFAGQQGTFEAEGTIKDDSITGVLAFGGMFDFDFSGTRSPMVVDNDDADESEDDANAGMDIATLLPGRFHVSSLEASRYQPKRVYVTFDAHRSNDDAPYAFVSNDYGQSWASLTTHLPADAGSTRVLREDRTNPNILYMGTEFGAWVSIDAGTTWTSLNTNLPTVAVHEIAQHETLNDIIVGTHGRSIWVMDATMLRQLSAGVIRDDEPTLFDTADVYYWRSMPSRGTNIRRFTGTNPGQVATIQYALPRGATTSRLTITDATGRVIRELDAPRNAGVNSVNWDLRERRRPGSRRRVGPRVEPGHYGVVLEIDNERLVTSVHVIGDPTYPDVELWGEQYDEQLELLEMFDEEEGDRDAGDRIE
ncbi:MAG: PDZ domain-containing protein [Planctomycetota bacterium]